MHISTRRIGPIGTSTRLLTAAGLLYLALFDGTSWSFRWYEGVGAGGLVALTMAVGLTARRYASGPLRFTGPGGLAISCAVIVALIANPLTTAAAELFYGATLAVAAVLAQPGCEATVFSNLILRRDDQVGCPTFSPIDAAEARLRRANRAEQPGGVRYLVSVVGAPFACCWSSRDTRRGRAPAGEGEN
jgi:hypothetical protein